MFLLGAIIMGIVGTIFGAICLLILWGWCRAWREDRQNRKGKSEEQ